MPWSWMLGMTLCACTVQSATFQKGNDDASVGDGGGSDIDACVPGSRAVALAHQPIDLIFLVDTSGDMIEETTALKGEFNQAAAAITAAGIDLRIVTISAYGPTPPDLCFPAPYGDGCTSGTTPTNTSTYFHYTRESSSLNAWCVAVNGYSTADTAGLAPTGWSAWVRPEAFKVFVLLSSDALSCTGFMDMNTTAGGTAAATALDTAIRGLSAIQFGTQGERRYTVMSIHNTVSAGGAPLPSTTPIALARCDSGTGYGTGHAGISILTEGARYPSCVAADYPAILADIATRSTKKGIACRTAPQGATVDRVSRNTGTSFVPLTRVASATDCAPDSYYVDTDTIALCPSTCDTVRETGLDLDVQVACPDP